LGVIVFFNFLVFFVGLFNAAVLPGQPDPVRQPGVHVEEGDPIQKNGRWYKAKHRRSSCDSTAIVFQSVFDILGYLLSFFVILNILDLLSFLGFLRSLSISMIIASAKEAAQDGLGMITNMKSLIAQCNGLLRL
jgi:hypothetical protein